MASTKEIKNRIKSIKNTKKITKAMELVAASKMKRAVSRTVDSRFYRNYAEEVLARIGDAIGNLESPFLEVKDSSKPELVILVSSNRGLCGGYNAQVFKKIVEHIKAKKGETKFIVVGKKGEAGLRRLKQDVIASFIDLPDVIALSHTLPISEFATQEFIDGNVSKVSILFTDYVSALSQVPKVSQLLPLDTNEIKHVSKEAHSTGEYLIEPNGNELLPHLVEELMNARVYQMILESVASEQSARMLAMKNASDAAGEMIDDLTLAFNKARQASITQEISEISSGMASVS